MTTPNDEYWAERFEALTDELLAGSGKAYETAERLFRMAERDIEADIARWYTRLAANNEISYAGARKLLKADELKEFKWTLEEYIKRGKENGVSADWHKELENASAKFHISRLESIRVQIRQHLEELYGNYADELEGAMRRTYSDGYYKTAYELETGLRAGFDVSKLDDGAIDTLLAKPWAADGKNFSDRIWQDKAKLIETLQTELIQGLIRGSTQADIVKRFAAKMKTSLSNAARLIATEGAYFAAVGERDGMKALGVEKYRYLATLDSKTSEICREMDGKIFTMAGYKPGVTAPPLHVWCRSTTVPYFGEKGGLRAARNAEGKTEYIPDMDYQDWKAVFVDKTKTLDAVRPKPEKNDIMRLPNYENAVMPEAKFLNYALDPERQPDKAKAFGLALGYNQSNYKELMENIRKHLSDFPVKEQGESDYGRHYSVLMKLIGANGKEANVRTAWIIDKGEEAPRLTSVYVVERGKTE